MKRLSLPIPKASQRGLTMIELMAALAILGMITVLFARFIREAAKGTTQSENRSDLLRITQIAKDNLRQAMAASQVLFANYPGGTPNFSSYQTRIAAGIAASPSQAPQPVSFSAHPLVTDTSKVDSSVASNFGNQLMFAAAIPALTMTVQVSSAPLVNEQVSLDRYQFVAIYLGGTRHPVAGFGSPPARYGCMQLVEWRSIPYVSYSHLARLAGSKLAATCAALVAAGYTWAWDVSAVNAASAFYAITASSPYIATTASAPASFPENGWNYLWGYEKTMAYDYSPNVPIRRGAHSELFGGVSSYPSRYCVCYNSSTLTAAADVRVNSLYGDYRANLNIPFLAAPTATGFPGGFEVLIFGQAGAREMYARISYLASSGVTQEPKAPKTYLAATAESYVSFVNAY